jgi:hypothetical protein
MTALPSTSSSCKRHTRLLVRQSAPHQEIRNCLTAIKIWPYAPDGCFIPRQTGRLTVGLNIRLRLKIGNPGVLSEQLVERWSLQGRLRSWRYEFRFWVLNSGQRRDYGSWRIPIVRSRCQVTAVEDISGCRRFMYCGNQRERCNYFCYRVVYTSDH